MASKLHSARHIVAVCCLPDAASSSASLCAAIASLPRVEARVVELDSTVHGLAPDARRLIACIVVEGPERNPRDLNTLVEVKRAYGAQIFTILFGRGTSLDPAARLAAADAGINMVSHVESDVHEAIKRASMMPPIDERLREPKIFKFDCPLCPLARLDQATLWLHMPLFHSDVKKSAESQCCPICGLSASPIVVHVHDEHAPPGHPVDRSRSGVPLYSFALLVVRRRSDGKFLVVQEYGSLGYWLPGGGIDVGEMPVTAAVRECMEEAGVNVKITGLLRMELSPGTRRTRLRFIFFGEPIEEDKEPKTLPDFESIGACWVSLGDVTSGAIRLRGSEPAEWFQYIVDGGAIHPLSILDREGAPPPSH